MRDRKQEWQLPGESIKAIAGVEELLGKLVAIENGSQRDQAAIAFIGRDDEQHHAYLILETAQRRRVIMCEFESSYGKLSKAMNFALSAELLFEQSINLFDMVVWEWMMRTGPSLISRNICTRDIVILIAVYMLGRHAEPRKVTSKALEMMGSKHTTVALFRAPEVVVLTDVDSVAKQEQAPKI